MIPTKWNQACFDAIFYHRKGVVDFVQVTLAKTHTYKLQHLEPFLEKLIGIKKTKKAKKARPMPCIRFFVLIRNSNHFKISENHFESVETMKKFQSNWSVNGNVSVISFNAPTP
jgi:hypothetical protein